MNTFLKDSKGNDSIMRIVFVFIIIFGSFMALLRVWLPYDQGAVIAVFGSITALAISLKLGQKGIDKEA
jgi:hypothetical protein